MVNAGRVACIFTPFLLSAASLICLLLVFLGGTSQHNNTLDSYYFLKADLSNFTLSSALAASGLPADELSAISSALETAKKDLNLKDYYTIYLWNYCAWDGTDAYAYCSPRQSEFWFNPIEVWGLNSSSIAAVLPSTLTDGLKAYETVSKYMFIIYVAAFVATCLTVLIGISAIFSRWGSFFTTFFASLAAVLTIAASAVATALFATVEADFNKVFKAYGIKASLGMPMLRATWLAVVFALGAGFFWLLSVCCCSGRSPYNNRGDQRRVKVEKTPYTYERVGSPYLGPSGGQAMPLNDMPSHKQPAYEPMRHQQV